MPRKSSVSIDALVGEIERVMDDLSTDSSGNTRTPRASSVSVARHRPLPSTPKRAPTTPVSPHSYSAPHTAAFAALRRDSDTTARQLPSVSRKSSHESVPPAYSVPPGDTHAHIPSLIGTVVDLACVSQVAQLLTAVLERKPLVKGSIVYPLSFTGRTLVETLAAMLVQYVRVSPYHALDEASLLRNAHHMALSLAHSLQTQLFIHEADWEERAVTDDVSGVFMLYTDSLGTGKDASAHVAVPGLAPAVPLFVADDDVNVSLSALAAAAVCAAPVERDEPTGVLVPLTRCYSPTCVLSGGRTCYSPSCPRQGKAFATSTADDLRDVEPTTSKAWVECVPRSLVDALPREEVKRQNAIHEFVQKEELFLQDLNLLGVFAKRLEDSASVPGQVPPLQGARLASFVQDVFGKLDALVPHIARFVDALHERQREDGAVVQRIGDVVTTAALDWRAAYTAYVAHYPLALARLKAEAESNARMQRFVEDCRRHPAAGRHPLDNFLFRAPARLQRYHLHLESILRHTSKYSDDGDALQLAIEVLDEQCLMAQSGVDAAEARVELQTLAKQLTSKRPEDSIDMDLLSEQRRIVHRSRVFRRPDNFEFEWTSLEAILLDHYLVLAKPKVGPDGTKLVLTRKPIPVSCLGASGFDAAPTGRGSLNRHWLPPNVHEMYPFLVWHTFHTAQTPLTLYVCSAADRAKWQRVLMHKIDKRTSALGAPAPSAPFVRVDMSGDAFSALAEPSETYALVKDAPWARPDVTCAATWHWHQQADVRLVAIGTTEGVWIGRYAEPHTLRKVLHAKGVTQCAVLHEYRRFLVLADHSLIAYDLEALVPSGAGVRGAPVRLGGVRDVHFFTLGRVHGAPLLVYAKRKTSETSVRILSLQTMHDGGRPMLTGFHLLHKFYVFPEALQIQCADDGLIVSTPRGVHMYRYRTHMLAPLLLPRQPDERAHALMRQWESCEVHGVFHVPPHGWLVCCDRGAFWVDAQGAIVRTEVTFRWEKSVSCAVLHAGHIFACSATHIEVHDARTGSLVQVHEGRDVRMLVHNDTDTDLPMPPLFVERMRSAGADVQRVTAYVANSVH